MCSKEMEVEWHVKPVEFFAVVRRPLRDIEDMNLTNGQAIAFVLV
jgi:hypothetical protein